MSKQNIIALGLDNGNGTVIASARNCGRLYQAYFPAVYNTGNRRIDIDGEDVNVAIDPDFNANMNEFSFQLKNDVRRLYLGQSAYSVDGNPKRNIGPGRLSNTRFMRTMIYGALWGLMWDGMYVDSQEDNIVHLCVGLPPEWFYVDKVRRENFKKAYRSIINHEFTIGDNITVRFDQDFIFMGEGLGAYYDYIFEDDHSIRSGFDARDGILVVDAGQGTLDTAIITNGNMSKKDIISNNQYGIQAFYNETVEELKRAGVGGVKSTDIEQYHYTQTTNISGFENAIDLAFRSALTTYLDNFVSYISDIYGPRINQFASVLLVGGITKACQTGDCTEQLIGDLEGALDGRPVEDRGAYANASGYRKAVEGKVLKEGLIRKDWG